MRRLKIAALAVLAIPAGLIATFLVGETVSGGLAESWGHVAQLAPLLLVGALAWWQPKIAGWILVGFGALIAIVYLLQAGGRLQVATIVLVEFFLMLPIASGVLLVLSGRRPSHPGRALT